MNNQSQAIRLLARHKAFLLLVVAMMMLGPYVAIYLANLWRLPHYQFFPLMLAAVGYLIWERWKQRTVVAPDWISAVLVICSICVAIVSALFASPWIGYAAFLFAFAALLHCMVEDQSSRRLTSLILPLIIVWQPPLSINSTADGKLIQQLQVISAHLSSMWLDFFGFVHFSPGTVLQLPEKSFGVAEACSGVQSFFALLCFASLIAIFQRRSFLHSVLILGSSVFWAVLMNTVRITSIPISFELFGVDLSEGLVHDILGYTTMAIALLLLVSTDQLLITIPIISQVHDRNANPSTASIATQAQASVATIKFVPIAVCVLLVPVFALQCLDLYSSWGQQRKSIDFFKDDVFIDLQASDGPGNLGDWKFIDYHREDRSRAADLGERSDVWKYQSKDSIAIVSFDQAFPGWHELSVCYQVSGWTLKSRRVVFLEGEPAWPAIEFELQRGANEYTYVVFSMFDDSRNPMQPPGAWGGWSSTLGRIQNRLSPTVRGSLFTLAGYQIQLFYSYQNSLSEETRLDILKQFSVTRKAMLAVAKD